jgi:antitoxin YefM
MSVMPLGEFRDRLSEIVDKVETTHERITITKHGQPAVVIMAVDDLDSLEETLDILRTPGALEQIREAEAEYERGEYESAEVVLDRLRASAASER